MAQLMDDNACFEITVSVGRSRGPQIHACIENKCCQSLTQPDSSEVRTHPTILPVRWCHEVSVVKPGAILSISDDGVILSTTTSKVVLLEISSDFIKAISAKKNMSWITGRQ
jgi:hypothetical protein